MKKLTTILAIATLFGICLTSCGSTKVVGTASSASTGGYTAAEAGSK